MEVKKRQGIHLRASNVDSYLPISSHNRKKKKGRTLIAGLMPIQLALTMTWWRHMRLR